MDKKKALEILRQVAESVSLNYKDHQTIQEALKVLAETDRPPAPSEKDY